MNIYIIPEIGIEPMTGRYMNTTTVDRSTN